MRLAHGKPVVGPFTLKQVSPDARTYKFEMGSRRRNHEADDGEQTNTAEMTGEFMMLRA